MVLISRTESKLQDLKKEIDGKGYNGVETNIVVCDYSKLDQKARDTVSTSIQGIDVVILINNAGVRYCYPMFFNELVSDEVENLMEMNVNFTTWMTKFVIYGMVEHRRGAIINMSSGSSMYTLPLLYKYSGAKSFIVSFLKAPNEDYAKKGISVQCQI